YRSGIAPDPARLEAVEQRLGELARLRRKYGGTVEDLIRRREEVVAELERAAGGGEALAALEAAAESGRRAAAEWAGRLSVERRRVARELERDLGRELATLALDDARFAVRFGEGRALGPEGWDEIEFFLSANPGEEPRSLARIASGGELSRIMLALKTLAAAADRGVRRASHRGHQACPRGTDHVHGPAAHGDGAGGGAGPDARRGTPHARDARACRASSPAGEAAEGAARGRSNVRRGDHA